MAKKTAAASATHPPYAEMIKEAIVTLKERSGSSLAAMKKFVGQKYKLPTGWEKKLSMYVKKMTGEGKLTKVKGSWKLGEALKKAPSKPKKAVVEKTVKKKTAKPAAKAKKEVKKPKAATKKAAPATKKAPAAPKTKTTRSTTKAKTSPRTAKAASGGVKKPVSKKKTTKKAKK
ncbi:hypothetical protein BSKO_05371 [Bryopsis sp. KO-2023]|nr:hypothetical protein BSKO_05371 [Bryopsis sp. KO-2023]